MNNNQNGFSAVEALIIVVIVGLVGFGGWYVLSQDNPKDTNAKTAASSGNSDTSGKQNTDPYKGWKTYTWTSEGLTFKYPGAWSVEEDTAMGRVYIRNTKDVVTKEDRPETFQQLWLATNDQEASVQNEQSVKDGHPQGREILGSSPIATSTIKAHDLVINTYEYKTVGGQTLQAFWAGQKGKRFYATNATEVSEKNQADMVANLKKVLASVETKK